MFSLKKYLEPAVARLVTGRPRDLTLDPRDLGCDVIRSVSRLVAAGSISSVWLSW